MERLKEEKTPPRSSADKVADMLRRGRSMRDVRAVAAARGDVELMVYLSGLTASGGVFE